MNQNEGEMSTRGGKLIGRLVQRIAVHEGRPVTAKEVAKFLGVQEATISRWKTGATSLEQIEWLLRLLQRVPKEAWTEEIERVLREKK